jgi:hypothetical protein
MRKAKPWHFAGALFILSQIFLFPLQTVLLVSESHCGLRQLTLLLAESLFQYTQAERYTARRVPSIY